MALLGGMFNRKLNKQGVENRTPDSKLYRAISTASIVGLLLCIVLVVLATFQILKFSAALIGVVGTIGCLCLGCVLMLPWIKRLERGEMKTVSYVFIGLNALVPVLWIIAIWIVVGVATKGSISTGLMNFIKAVVIISLQFIVASYVATGITKYKKTMVVFQAIAYTCYLYVDFLLTYVLCCVKIGGEDVLSISKNIALLNNIWVWAIFVIAVIFIGVANGLMYRNDFRRLRNAADDLNYKDKKQAEQAAAEKPSETLEQQLESLKNLLDKNLITQEEYDKKRAEIIDQM